MCTAIVVKGGGTTSLLLQIYHSFFGVSQDTHLSAWLIFIVPYKLTFLWYNNPLQIFFLLGQTFHR